jgi:hypothetical protein
MRLNPCLLEADAINEKGAEENEDIQLDSCRTESKAIPIPSVPILVLEARRCAKTDDVDVLANE